MRKVVLAIAAAVVLFAIIYIVISLRDEDERSESARSGTARSSSTTNAPTLGGAATGSAAQQHATFQARKNVALQRVHGEVERVVRACEPRGEGMAPPSPRTITLDLEWDPTLSTPELQRYVVRGVVPTDANAPIATETRRCLDRAIGTTMNLLLPIGELPENAKRLREPISLPLR